MPYKLTLKNYYSPKRPHVSNSMLGIYKKSPALYKKMFIDKEPGYEFVCTDAMKRGLVVDAALTQGDCPYQVKVLKRDDPETFALQKDMDPRYLLNETNWQQATEIIERIEEQPFWHDGFDKRIFQMPLEGKINDVLVCGLPDWIDPAGEGHWRMVDLKVVSAMKITNPRKWFMNAMDMGYFRQAAIYQHLFAELKGVPKHHVPFSWAVASYVQKGLVQVELYHAPQEHIDKAMDEVERLLDGIKNKRFEDRLLTWKDEIDLNVWLEKKA